MSFADCPAGKFRVSEVRPELGAGGIEGIDVTRIDNGKSCEPIDAHCPSGGAEPCENVSIALMFETKLLRGAASQKGLSDWNNAVSPCCTEAQSQWLQSPSFELSTALGETAPPQPPTMHTVVTVTPK